jgi:hypothetical protein
LNPNEDFDILRKLGYKDDKDLTNNLLQKFDLLKKIPTVKELKVNNDILKKLNKTKPFFLSEIPKLQKMDEE